MSTFNIKDSTLETEVSTNGNLSGGTLIGRVKTQNIAGYETNIYGNLIHTQNAAATFEILPNTGSAVNKFNIENGNFSGSSIIVENYSAAIGAVSVSKRTTAINLSSGIDNSQTINSLTLSPGTYILTGHYFSQPTSGTYTYPLSSQAQARFLNSTDNVGLGSVTRQTIQSSLINIFHNCIITVSGENKVIQFQASSHIPITVNYSVFEAIRIN